ncbi:MAG: D-2-hydroxyacid dehydrogenase [Bacillota bacterium]|nr:D-2-hydroxyacid dehydrogenase [Bacillota bacterium]
MWYELKLCILDLKCIGNDLNINVFDKYGKVEAYQMTKPDEVAGRIKDCDVIITNKILLNKSNLINADKLKLICITATGTNNVDLDYTRQKGIAVTNVAGYSTWSVTQHTFAMLFYVLEQLKYYDEFVKSGEYSRSDCFNNLDKPFSDIQGKTWGVIGLGAIGSAVASVARAFGCKVIYYSTSGKNNNPEYQRAELDDLLKTSDIVSVHAPLNDRTKDLIQYRHIGIMKKSAVLMNLGRGGIVNELDLALALDDKLIAYAAVDVLEHEPIAQDNPLMQIKDKSRLLITPHIAWASIEARNRLIDEIATNIEAFINNESRNRVC